MKTVAIASPYGSDSLMGNVVTAERIAGILQECGYTASVTQGWGGGEADVLLALHAVKGTEAVRQFRQKYPAGKVVVLLTGTDLYRDLAEGSEKGRWTLDRADRLVVMTEAARERVPEDFRDKVRVISQSVVMPSIDEERDQSVFGVSIVGHLREVKHPFQMVRVMARRPEWDDMRVWQVGFALNAQMASTAESWQEHEPRYHWLGGIPREEGLRWVKRSSLSVNTSWMEGASSALMEAMILGVPVLASRVEGNVGLLGEDHEGLFEAGNDDALDVLVRRVLQDPSFWEALQQQGWERSRLFSRAAEAQNWISLLKELD